MKVPTKEKVRGFDVENKKKNVRNATFKKTNSRNLMSGKEATPDSGCHKSMVNTNFERTATRERRSFSVYAKVVPRNSNKSSMPGAEANTDGGHQDKK